MKAKIKKSIDNFLKKKFLFTFSVFLQHINISGEDSMKNESYLALTSLFLLGTVSLSYGMEDKESNDDSKIHVRPINNKISDKYRELNELFMERLEEKHKKQITIFSIIEMEEKMKPLCSVEEKTNFQLDTIKNEKEIYQRFLGGKLIYRPQEGSDVGRIEIPISALQNPLEGTFDLSQCGDTGKYLSISTGYRKGKRPENANKVEVWLTPRFLIERELQTTAIHFQGIMGDWYETAPVGIFWTWGGWDNLSDYDYLVTLTMNDFYSDNLYKMRTQAGQNRAGDGSGCRGVRNGQLFHVSFGD